MTVNKSESVNVGNVQPHSCGDLYPCIFPSWHDFATGHGRVQAVDVERGWQGRSWPYTRLHGDGYGSFKVAQQYAEAEARQHLSQCRDSEPLDTFDLFIDELEVLDTKTGERKPALQVTIVCDQGTIDTWLRVASAAGLLPGYVPPKVGE